MPAPSRRSGRRYYDEDAVRRLTSIRIARSLGLSIGEIRRLAAMNLTERRDFARTRARLVMSQIAALQHAAERLEDLSNCDCADGADCRL